MCIRDRLSADKLMYIAKNSKNTVITEWDNPDPGAPDENDAEYESMKQKILIVDDSAINRALLSEKMCIRDSTESCGKNDKKRS